MSIEGSAIGSTTDPVIVRRHFGRWLQMLLPGSFADERVHSIFDLVSIHETQYSISLLSNDLWGRMVLGLPIEAFSDNQHKQISYIYLSKVINVPKDTLHHLHNKNIISKSGLRLEDIDNLVLRIKSKELLVSLFRILYPPSARRKRLREKRRSSSLSPALSSHDGGARRLSSIDIPGPTVTPVAIATPITTTKTAVVSSLDNTSTKPLPFPCSHMGGKRGFIWICRILFCGCPIRH